LGLKKTYKHSIDVIIDMIEIVPEESSRLLEALEKSFALAAGMCKITVDDVTKLYSAARMCMNCQHAIPELEPRLFSFNSPIGACPSCHGLGVTIHLPWN